MTTDDLPPDLEPILAAKRQFLTERRGKTPIAAVIALADMQRKPQQVLTTVTDGSHITLIGQVTHSETYDPVALTLRYIREGVDAVSLFTDARIYRRGLDDLLLVSRGVNIPVISQDYILDDYHVVEARAAGASALVLSARVLDQATLRKVVSVTQRWRMTAIVQAATEQELASALNLSPHVIGIGDASTDECEAAIELMRQVRPRIGYNVRAMIINPLHTVEQVAAAVQAGVDAVMISQKPLESRAALNQIKAMLHRSE